MPTTSRSGLEIHYEVFGEGPPIALLHGLMGSSEVWRITGWLERLTDFQLLLVDVRGHGRSAAPIDAALYGPHHDASDVIAVLDEVGVDRAVICGWSLGAAIALQTAGLHPGRVSMVVALGLPAAWVAFEDTPKPDSAATRADAELFEQQGTRHVVESLVAERRQEWVPMIERADGKALGARLRGLVAAIPIRLRLRELRQPLLLVWGDGEEPRVGLPLPEHAQGIVIEGEDHVGALGRTDVILPALRRLVEQA